MLWLTTFQYNVLFCPLLTQCLIHWVPNQCKHMTGVYRGGFIYSIATYRTVDPAHSYSPLHAAHGCSTVFLAEMLTPQGKERVGRYIREKSRYRSVCCRACWIWASSEWTRYRYKIIQTKGTCKTGWRHLSLSVSHACSFRKFRMIRYCSDFV